MRITIPKSQGKQPYYDARKSSWGDIFPHPPKNTPHERSISGRDRSFKSKKESKKRDQGGLQRQYSEHLAASIREAKKSKRRWQQNVDPSTIWGKEDY